MHRKPRFQSRGPGSPRWRCSCRRSRRRRRPRRGCPTAWSSPSRMRIVTFRVFVKRSQKRFFLGTFRLFPNARRGHFTTRARSPVGDAASEPSRDVPTLHAPRAPPRVFHARVRASGRARPPLGDAMAVSSESRLRRGRSRFARRDLHEPAVRAPRTRRVVAASSERRRSRPERRAARAAPRRASRARQETQARPRSRSRTVRVDERGERANLFSLDGARRFVSQRNVVGRRVGRDEKPPARKRTKHASALDAARHRRRRRVARRCHARPGPGGRHASCRARARARRRARRARVCARRGSRSTATPGSLYGNDD